MTTKPNEDPATEIKDPKEVAPAPPQGGEDPEGGSEIKLTTKALDERLERAKRSYLKEVAGTSDPKALETKLKRLEELEKAKVEAERAALTEQERLKADAQAAEARAQAAIQERDAIAFENRVSRICAELGVTNVEYAMFSIARAAEDLGDDGKLDPKAHLQGLLKEPTARAALGAPGESTRQKEGATTTTAKTEPKPENTNPPTKSAFDLDAKTWQERKRNLGI